MLQVNIVDVINVLELLNEAEDSRYPSGRGKYSTKNKSGNLSIKSRVKVYPTIKDALKKKGPGHIFSTDGARRLYVVSKRTKGGTDSESVVSGRIAKGFTPGSSTPSSEWGSVKDHAARVGYKYSGKKAKKLSPEARRKSRQDKEGK